MGTVDELRRLVRFCVSDGIRPLIHDVLPLQDARRGFEALNAENVVGKIVLTV
jgi:D-arabinose 1-dehydrogenase-like Zn-dependent alcohol dehydrogenase